MSRIIVVEDNEPLARGIVYALEKEGIPFLPKYQCF